MNTSLTRPSVEKHYSPGALEIPADSSYEGCGRRRHFRRWPVVGISFKLWRCLWLPANDWLPPGNGRIQVSLNGGNMAHGRGDGHELFFITPGNTIMAADVQTGNKIQASVPHELFTALIGDATAWDVTPDGKRFLIWQHSNSQSDNPITVVMNWWVAPR